MHYTSKASSCQTQVLSPIRPAWALRITSPCISWRDRASLFAPSHPLATRPGRLTDDTVTVWSVVPFSKCRMNSDLRVFRRLSPSGDIVRPAGPVCLRRQAAQGMLLPYFLPRLARREMMQEGAWPPAIDLQSAGPRRTKYSHRLNCLTMSYSCPNIRRFTCGLKTAPHEWGFWLGV